MKILQKLQQKLNEYERAPATVENTVQVYLHNLLIKQLDYTFKSSEAELTRELFESRMDEVVSLEDFYRIMQECGQEAAKTIKEIDNYEYESALHSSGRTVFSGDLGRKGID